MRFIYIHVIRFGYWIGFGIENHPHGLLIMIVSLGLVLAAACIPIAAWHSLRNRRQRRGAEPTPGQRGSFFVPGAGFEPAIFASLPRARASNDQEKRAKCLLKSHFRFQSFALLPVA